MFILKFLVAVFLAVALISWWPISVHIAAVSACDKKIVEVGAVERLRSLYLDHCIAIFEDGRIKYLGKL